MKTSNWASGPVRGAFARRERQAAWLNTADFRAYSEHWLIQHGITGGGINIDAFPAVLSRHWNSPSFVLSPTATAATFSAAATLNNQAAPPFPMLQGIMDGGVAVLASTLWSRDAHGQDSATSAVSWGPCFLNGGGGTGVVIVSWAHMSEGRDAEVRDIVSNERQWTTEGPLPEYIPKYVTVVPHTHGRQFGVGARTHECDETSALGALDPEAASLSERLLRPLAAMVRDGALALQVPPAPAPRMVCVEGTLGAENLLLVTATLKRHPTGLRWALARPLGGSLI